MTAREFTPFYRFASRGVIIPALKLMTKQHVRGLEHLPTEGGFIAVANHISEIDSLTTMRALVDVDIPVRALAKSTIFDVPVLGKVFSAGRQIPVKRGTANAREALGAAKQALDEGDAILIFPEGTLTRDPLKWPMVGKTGTARLAMMTGVPVIPMGQWGAHHVLDTYSKTLRPFPRKDVNVLIGEALDLSRFGNDPDDREQVQACTAHIMAAITSLVEELRGEKAPRPFDMRYDGDPGKGRLGVRKPDPVPGEGTDTAGGATAESAQ